MEFLRDPGPFPLEPCENGNSGTTLPPNFPTSEAQDWALLFPTWEFEFPTFSLADGCESMETTKNKL